MCPKIVCFPFSLSMRIIQGLRYCISRKEQDTLDDTTTAITTTRTLTLYARVPEHPLDAVRVTLNDLKYEAAIDTAVCARLDARCTLAESFLTRA